MVELLASQSGARSLRGRARLRALCVATLALLGLGASACVPRGAEARAATAPGMGQGAPQSAGLSPDDDEVEAGAEPSSGAGGDGELAIVNDDFAALAYALHGLEEPTLGEADPDDPLHAEGHDGHDDEHESDDIETPAEWSPPSGSAKSPLAGLSGDEIRRRLKDDPSSLGSISIGPPNRGALFNGVQMPLGDRWALTEPGSAYGTRESIDQLVRCIDAVHEKYPKSPKMIVGHWSARRGGRLKPHKSHQSGRDVDVSYYYTAPTGWYALATHKNLDRPRTWAFVKALLTRADVEMILIDTSLQKLLRDYALAAGEERGFVDRVFQIAGEKQGFAPIRHARGHATHIHIRFRSPEAVASGRVAEAYLPRPAPAPKERGSAKRAVAQKDSKAPAAAKSAAQDDEPKDTTSYVSHRARSGDTLDALARRYGTTVAAIREANGLKGNALKMKRSYKIPVAKPAPRPAAKSGARAGKRKG